MGGGWIGKSGAPGGNVLQTGVFSLAEMNEAKLRKAWYGMFQDTFDTDSSAQYTQHNAGSWTISGGELVAVGGTQTAFIRNGTSFADVIVECDSNFTDSGGLVARFQDANNYYILRMMDDSGAIPTQNLAILRRSGGSNTTLASVDLSWPRNTTAKTRFELIGATINGYFNETLVVTATDSTITAAGGVGVRNDGGGSSTSKYQAFRWQVPA